MQNVLNLMKNNVLIFLLISLLFSGCGGSHGKSATEYPPVPATACGVGTLAATVSDDIRFIDPVNISDAGGLSEHPSIVASRTGGRVYVTWDDDKLLPSEDVQKKDIYFRLSNDYGSTYQPAVNVSNTGNATISSVGVGDNGSIHVAWQDVSTGPSEVFYAKSTNDGATFSSPRQISSAQVNVNDATQSTDVFLAVDPRPVGTENGGYIYIVWSEANLMNATFSLKIARSTDDGASFTIVHTYTPPNGASASTPTLNIAADGDLHLSWSESTVANGATVRTIRYSKSTDAGIGLSTPKDLESGSTLSSPSIATFSDNSNDRVYIAWRNEDDADIHFTASNNGGTDFSFRPSSSILASPNINSRAISSRLATGHDGTLYLSWTDNRDGNYDTYFSKSALSTDKFNDFTAPANFSPSAQGSLFTAIAVDGEGNIYIAADDNRYSNPVGTNAQIADEGNFEILVARGKNGLPAVTAASASPCPITPNGDLNSDTTTFTATFSHVLTWTLELFDSKGVSVLTVTGSGSSMSYVWDGRRADGTVIDDIYTYKISGIDGNGVASTSGTGELDLYTTSADAAPVIVVDPTDAEGNPVPTSSFKREAFGFSPNGDGFKDTDGIEARFNKPVNWAIQIKDSAGAVKRTFTGSGLSINSEITRWDGKDEAGNVLPEANYIVSLTITDGQGRSASCGVLPVACLNMEIDSTKPDVPDAAVDQITYDPLNGTVNVDPAPDSQGRYMNRLAISGTPAELSLVTIYVYNQVGVLVRKVDRNFRDANQTFQVLWDGKNGDGQVVTAGSYQVWMWCRDRAGNTAEIYPRKLDFTVELNP